LSNATEYGINTHMGTQLGVINRVIMTIACVLVLFSAFLRIVDVVEPPAQRSHRPPSPTGPGPNSAAGRRRSGQPFGWFLGMRP
jgi:hypothetical protein